MTTFAKVDVKDVKSEVQRSSFLEAEIEKLANSILKSGGILKPLVLKQIGVESYKVLDGHLEYYASVRAREKDPRQAEMVNAFVILPKDEPAAHDQINVLKGSSTNIIEPLVDKGSSGWISSFEERLSKINEELLNAKLQNDNRFAQIEKTIKKPEKVNLLDFLNSSDKQTLIDQLPRYGVSNARGIPEKIYDVRKQKESMKFDSYQDVVKLTKGFGAAGMLKLIDAWLLFNNSDRF